MGAWIETGKGMTSIVRRQVAPYVGAWIETDNEDAIMNGWYSRTLRGCVD